VADGQEITKAGIPPHHDWKKWTIEQAVQAITGDSVDLTQLVDKRWFTFVPEGAGHTWDFKPGGDKPDLKGELQYHAYGKQYYGVNVDHDAVRTYEEGFDKFMAMGPPIGAGIAGWMDASGLNSLRDLIVTLQRFLDDRGKDYRTWAKLMDSNASDFDGKAAAVLQSRMDNYADSLEHWAKQIRYDYGGSLVDAVSGAATALNTFNYMASAGIDFMDKNKIHDIVQFKIDQYVSAIGDYLTYWGLQLAARERYLLDYIMEELATAEQLYLAGLIKQWPTFPTEADFDQWREWYINEVLYRYPRGDLRSPDTWDNFNKEITASAHLALFAGDIFTQDAIGEVYNKYQILGRAFHDLEPPRTPHNNQFGPNGAGGFPNYNPFAGMENYDPFAGMENYNPFAGMENYNPFAGMENYNPFAGMENYNPMAGMENYNPFAGMENYNPMAGMQNYNPLAGLENYNPLSGLENYNPFGGLGNSNPYGDLPNTDALGGNPYSAYQNLPPYEMPNYGDSPYGQSPYGNYNPGDYGLGNYGPGAFSPGAYSPGDYGPGNYGPGAYSPGDYGLGNYAPGQVPGMGNYSPGDYGLGNYGPGQFGGPGLPGTGVPGGDIGPHGEQLDPNGQPVLGPHKELIGPDGKPVLGPYGQILGPDGQSLLGPHKELLGPDGQSLLGPQDQLLGPDGQSLLGQHNELLGPDGNPIIGPNGQPILGTPGQVFDPGSFIPGGGVPGGSGAFTPGQFTPGDLGGSTPGSFDPGQFVPEGSGGGVPGGSAAFDPGAFSPGGGGLPGGSGSFDPGGSLAPGGSLTGPGSGSFDPSRFVDPSQITPETFNPPSSRLDLPLDAYRGALQPPTYSPGTGAQIDSNGYAIPSGAQGGMSGGSGGPAGFTGAPAGAAGLGGMGGMPFMPPMGGPMGGMGGPGGSKEERERQTWLSEDEEVWGTSAAVGAGVIGRPDEDEDEFDPDEMVLPAGPVRTPRPGATPVPARAEAETESPEAGGDDRRDDAAIHRG
jgi:hypothetical protein